MKMVGLRARRKEVPDIVPALFEAYMSASDRAFSKYMESKETDYEDNMIKELENADLMGVALDKYKMLVEKKAWGKKTKDELEFIAMKAKLAQAR